MHKGSRIRVGMMRGGTSTGYDASLQTGASLLRHLSPDKYVVHDILVGKDGTWYFNGVKRAPHQIFKHADVLLNALHGGVGENGKLQKYLDAHGIIYTGSGALASAMATNKLLAKQVLDRFGIKTPYFTHLRIEQYGSFHEKKAGTRAATHVAGSTGASHKKHHIPTAHELHHTASELFSKFPQPCVIKPVDGGSSIGVSIVQTIPDIEVALKTALEHSPVVLVEEYIQGREVTIGVIDHFRGQRYYPLLPVEIIPAPGSPFYDYAAKHSGKSLELCPGNFSPEESHVLQQAAQAVHKALGLRHYSRIDFILHPKRGVFFLEANTLPGLTPESLFPKSLAAVGASLADFADHIIQLALNKK